MPDRSGVRTPRKVGNVWHRTIVKPHTRGVAKSPDPCNNTFKRDNPAQLQRIMLTGTALKETVDALTAQGKTRSEIAIACGYCTVEGNNTKIHFTDFYMALLEVKQDDDIEEETIEAEDPDNQETINQLLEDYSAAAIEAFIELYGEENVEHFEDAYQGEFESGAHFAESLVSDCYCLDIPAFVCIDWEATSDQLYYDYSIEDGHVFCDNF